MTREPEAVTDEVVTGEWVSFPGSELEGKRPRALCQACREELRRSAMGSRRFVPETPERRAGGPIEREGGSEANGGGAPRAFRVGASASGVRMGLHARKKSPLCFQCYRAELDRARSLQAAGELNTASAQRFQSQLPFEPINKARLETLKADRAVARAAMLQGVGRFADKRRRAQIEARHALQGIAVGLATEFACPDRDRAMVAAIHAAEMQLPESWLPFVVSR